MTANNTPDDTGIRGRNGNGQFVRTIEGAQRDAEAARLYSQGGITFREVGEQLGISKWAAISAYNRAVRDVVQEAGEEALKVHTSRLEYAVARCMEIAETDHVMVSHGRIVYDDTGQPLKDSAPILAALREMRGALADFRRMTGMDKPAKLEHSGGVTYEVVGVDPEDLT
ncbi:hypothetical protein DV517_62210 [Streptomyces sp. S816]|uniref:hypothetical protein n=1 Tax=Streptomyces sp. S816 TaxID=2283197 RepID=UPI00109CDCD5|nr:hypothetical protein [Streptomyces sp. S816]TGZ14738.1 hypothetical protein DV517_62210 [Streptomyces sp. S816]